MLLFALGNLLIPLAPAHALLLGAAFLVAQQLIGDSGGTVYEIVETSLVQSSVDNRVIGRVNATFFTFTTLMTLAGVVIGGVIAEMAGLRAAFAFGLLGAVLSIIVIWLSPVRHIRDTTMTAGPALPGDEAPLTE